MTLYYAEKDGYGLYIPSAKAESYEADGYTVTVVEETDRAILDTETDKADETVTERVNV